MRLWHQSLIPYLDRQRLLGQHRECAALRGKGWGKKHATVDYVFTHYHMQLVAYHYLVMEEMKNRGYNPDKVWYNPNWRGSVLGEEKHWACQEAVDVVYKDAKNGKMIYPEHNDAYLAECIALLKEKDAPIDWSVVERDLGAQLNMQNVAGRL